MKKRIEQHALRHIVIHLTFSVEMLGRLPHVDLAQVLREERIAVAHEDEVFEVLSTLTSGMPEDRAEDPRGAPSRRKEGELAVVAFS